MLGKKKAEEEEEEEERPHREDMRDEARTARSNLRGNCWARRRSITAYMRGMLDTLHTIWYIYYCRVRYIVVASNISCIYIEELSWQRKGRFLMR